MKTKNRNKHEKGITLIALVVTIVVLLILAAVTIVMTFGENGIIQKSKNAKNSTIKATADDEVELAVSNLKMEKVVRDMTAEERRKYLEDDLKKIDKDSTVTINESKLDIIYRGFSYSVDDDLKIGKDDENTPFDPVEWDKTAVPESAFIWESDDPNDEGYNTIIGYKSTIDNYPILRYPSRCKIIREDTDKTLDKLKNDYEGSFGLETIRRSTSNIKVKEYPETVTEISGEEFRFNSVKKIKLPKSLKKIGNNAFSYLNNLIEISIPENVETIEKDAFMSPKNVYYGNYYGDYYGDVLIICIKKKENSIEGAPWGANGAAVIWNSDGSELNKEYMTATEKKEWDKTAVPEDVFYWESDTPGEDGYNTIIGYKESISNYPIVRYPSRCKIVAEDTMKVSAKVNETYNLNYVSSIRSYTSNIKKKEYPDSVLYIGGENTFSSYNLESVRLSNNLKAIGNGFVFGFSKLKTIKIPKSVTQINKMTFDAVYNLVINIEGDNDSISGAPWGASNVTINWNYTGE